MPSGFRAFVFYSGSAGFLTGGNGTVFPAVSENRAGITVHGRGIAFYESPSGPFSCALTAVIIPSEHTEEKR